MVHFSRIVSCILLLPCTSSAVAQKPLIDRINFFRCELCAHQWFDSAAYPKCHVFMTRLCNPGPDGIMNGSPGERTTGHGWCYEFFNRDPNAAGPTVTSSGAGGPAGAPAFAQPPAAPGGAPAPGPAPARPRPTYIDPTDPDADYIGVIWTRRMVENGEGMDQLSPEFIFGEPGQPDFLSRKDIQHLPRNKIVERVENVRRRLDDRLPLVQGQIDAVGPLPFDFPEIFAEAVADAVPGISKEAVKVTSIPDESSDEPDEFGDVRRVLYTAPSDVVEAVRHQAIDPNSRLVNGIFRKFLIAKSKFHRYSEEEKEFWMS